MMLVCRSGVLVCNLETATSSTGETKQLICMDFPLLELFPARETISTVELADSLGIPPTSILALKQKAHSDVLVHIESASFPLLKPNMQKIAALDAR